MGPWTKRVGWFAGIALASACSHANDIGQDERAEAPVAEGESVVAEDAGASGELSTPSGEIAVLEGTVCAPEYVSAICPNTTDSVAGWPKMLLNATTYTSTGWKGEVGKVGPGLANTWVVVTLDRTNAVGDPDLYVKKNGAVSESVFDCRPYTETDPEYCSFFLESDTDYLSVGLYVFSVSAGNPTVAVAASANRCSGGTVYTGVSSYSGSGASVPPAMKCCSCVDGYTESNGQCCLQPEPCTNASECDSGFCVDGYCCNGACAGNCDRCNLPGSLGICKAAPFLSPGEPSCGVYVCDGVSPSCPTSCTFDVDCIDGYRCESGSCVPKAANGTACTWSFDCMSGHCVDGVCCNAECDGGCESCTLPGSVGTCKVIAAGGQGQGCGLFRCSGKGPDCPDACEADAQCVTGAYCAFGTCQTKVANGSACSADEQCQSGHCVDSTCCDTACDGQCERCDAPETLGVCTAVLGKPVGGRPSCGDDGTGCGGSCDGVNGATCFYPGASVTCGAASCVNGVATEAGRCDGEGSCQSKTQACAPYACGETGCLTSCASEADCVAPAICQNGVCIGTLERGASCVNGGECKSGFCVDGVCCNSACDGACQACDLPGSVGTCTAEVGGECAGAGGGGGGDEAADPFLPMAEEEDGCGCRVAGAKTDEKGPLVVALLAGLAIFGRRKRLSLP